MPVFYFLSIWVHILAAAVWIGGMVFIALVLVPAMRRSAHQEVATSVILLTSRRFRWIGWGALSILILTGVVNLAQRGFEWTDILSGEGWEAPLPRLLGIKLLLVAVILILSVLHDFMVGPRAIDLMQKNPASLQAFKSRRRASWFGRFNLLLALGTTAIGVMLARGGF